MLFPRKQGARGVTCKKLRRSTLEVPRRALCLEGDRRTSSSGATMADYGDKHALFVQVMMSSPVLAEHEALNRYRKILVVLEEDRPAPMINDLWSLLEEINNELKSLDMQLRVQTCEVTTMRYITLINTVMSPLNTTLHNYTTKDLLYFKKVVDEIVGSDEGEVSHILCLNVENMQPLCKADLEKLLCRFVEEMWLAVHKAGKYSLGIRSLSELRPFLTATYKDYLAKCPLCSEIILQGFRCIHCSMIGHPHCLFEYAKQNRGKAHIKCPGKDCREALENVEKFLEEAHPAEDVEDVEADLVEGPSTSKKTRAAKK